MFGIRLSAEEIVISLSCVFLAFSLVLLAGLMLFKVQARLRAIARARRAVRFKVHLRRWRSGLASNAALVSRAPGDLDILEPLLVKEAAMLASESRRRVIALIEKLGLVDRALRRLERAKQTHGLLAVLDLLGRLGSKRSVAALSGLLDHPGAPVRFHAARALSRIGGRTALAPLLAVLPREAEADGRPWVALVVRFGMSAAPKMRLALRKGSPALRWIAVNVLGLLRDPAASEQLAGVLLRDADPRLREAAAIALGNLANPLHIPWLSAALRDPEAAVRARVVEALGNCPDSPAAAGALAGVLGDPARSARLNAIRALAKLGPAGQRILEGPREAGA